MTQQPSEKQATEHGCIAVARGMSEFADKLDAWARRLRPPASVPPRAVETAQAAQ